MRKPTFKVTWKCATLPSTTWPRVSVTSNQSMRRMGLAAVSMALRIASSLLSCDEPTSSTSLYTWSDMACSSNSHLRIGLQDADRRAERVAEDREAADVRDVRRRH